MLRASEVGPGGQRFSNALFEAAGHQKVWQANTAALSRQPDFEQLAKSRCLPAEANLRGGVAA